MTIERGILPQGGPLHISLATERSAAGHVTFGPVPDARARASDPAPTVALPIVLLAAAGFLSSAGARVVDSLLRVMAHDLHSSVPEVSVVLAAFTLPYGLNQLLLGPIGDRYGKLRVLLCALLGYAVATGACALAPSLGVLTLMRAIAGGASAGLIPVSLAYIGDMVPYRDRQLVLSRFLTGVVVAQMVAGPVGGFFGDSIGWRGVFVLLAVAALVVAGLLATRLARLPDTASKGAPRTGGAASWRNYLALARHPTARLLLLGSLVDGMLFTGSLPFLAPYLADSFGLSFASVGLILACFGVGALIFTRTARSLLRLFGEAGMVLTGCIGAGLALAWGISAGTWAVFPMVELLLGLGYFMMHSTLQARATEMLTKARATAVSCFVFMLFLGQTIGALATGMLIARNGYQIAFLADAAGLVLLGLVLWLVLRRPLAGMERVR